MKFTVLSVFKPQCPNLMVASLLIHRTLLVDAGRMLRISSHYARRTCSAGLFHDCSPAEELSIPAYVPPSMPTVAAAASEGIKKAATEEKLTGPIEMSDLRETDHGPGRFVLCIRGVDLKI